MSPVHRCTMFLASALILCLAVPLAAQDDLLFADGPAQDTPIDLGFAPLTFQQSALDTRLSAGIILDYVFDATYNVSGNRFAGTPLEGELRYEGGVRFSGILEYTLVPSAYWFVQAGIFKSDMENHAYPAVPRLGDLYQYSAMTGFKFTSTVPFIGKGRSWSEISLWPFGSVAAGAHYYDFDKNSDVFGPGTDLDFKTSFAGEARIGLELRIPPIVVVGINAGWYWSSPKFIAENKNIQYSQHDHFNVSTMIIGLQGELRF